MTSLLWVIGGVALFLGLLVLDRLAGRVVRPTALPVARTIPETGLPHEDIVIRSGPGELKGWFLHSNGAPTREPLLVAAHGWGANYSVVLRLAEPLARNGHEVLLFDVRGHGRNPPLPTVTIRDFRDDVVAAIRYGTERFPDRPMVLIGHSMGGAAGVVAAADGAPIAALALIAAPSDILRVTAEYMTDKGLPGPLMVAGLRPFFWRRVGGTFLPLTPSRRIADLEIPLLLIQPENDARVLRSHAVALADAAGRPVHIIDDREHTDVLDAPETLRLIEEFLESV